jgi:hypothetical protein
VIPTLSFKFATSNISIRNSPNNSENNYLPKIASEMDISILLYFTKPPIFSKFPGLGSSLYCITLEQWTNVIQSAEDTNEIHGVLFEYAREKVPVNVLFGLWYRRISCGMYFVSGRTKGRKK